jgi:hypothetical protein
MKSGGLLALALMCGCGGTTVLPATDAGGSPPDATVASSATDAAAEASVEGGLDASCTGVSDFDASQDVPVIDGSASLNVQGCSFQIPAVAAPPATACDIDASPDSSVCPLPASVCADFAWLTYYDDGQCMAGLCSWQAKDHYCPDGCRSGACADVARTAPPPPYQTTAQ